VVNNKFKSPDEQNEFLRIAHSSADRLETLVADIILLSDIDQNNLNLMRQTIDIENHILVPIKRRLARYEAKGLNFIHDISLSGVIKAPRREFAQSVMHLADNAFKFSPEHGTVKLAVKPGENGIPVDLREKVFERFDQVSQGDERQFQGLGVGLTIARAVFAGLGGEVKILESGQGCHVLASIPDLRPEDITYG
jgi:signal transduction histidine kinase